MKLDTKTRKKFRVTNKLKKFAKIERYRLSIFRSSKNISAQIIDDNKNITLLSASSVEQDIKESNTKNKLELSEELNKVIEKMIVKNPYQWIWTHNRWK